MYNIRVMLLNDSERDYESGFKISKKSDGERKSKRSEYCNYANSFGAKILFLCDVV